MLDCYLAVFRYFTLFLKWIYYTVVMMNNILCALSYVQVFYTFFIVSFQPMIFWQTFDFVCCWGWGGGVNVFWHFVGI